MTQVVVLGDVLTDVVARVDAPLAHGSDTAARVSFSGGGSAANTAAWLAQTGVRTQLAGRVGDDLAGHEQITALQRAGVEVRLTADPRASTGTCVVIVEPGGERTMLPDRGANLALDIADLPPLPFGGHLHVSGYTLFDPGPRAAALSALQRAREAGCTTSLDPSSAAPLAALGAGEFLAMTRGVDLLLPNRDEAEVLTGLADPQAAAGALAAASGAEVVVTAGDHAVHSAGATALADDVAVLDSTGAGDAFTAGLLSARLAGADAAAQLAAGHALGARAVQQAGARPPALPLLHLATRDAWTAAQAAGIYAIPPGAPFVHLCFPHQLAGVVERFFAGQRDLQLLELDPAGLDVRVETAPDGAGDFAHLYGPIPLTSVVRRIAHVA